MSTSAVTATPAPFEPFVDADRAATFLGMERRLLLDWSRRGVIPGHPWGDGTRRVWRYLLSELAEWGQLQQNCSAPGAARKTRIQ